MNRVLIVLPNSTLGGAEQVLKLIALYIPNSSVNVHFFCAKDILQWTELPKHVTLTYSSTKNEYIGWMLFIFHSMRNRKVLYDYIFSSHVLVTGLLGILINLGYLKKRYFIGRESTHVFKRFSGFKLVLYKTFYHYGYSALDLLICQTEKMKSDLLLNLPYLNSKICVKVIPNPICLQEISAESDPDILPPFSIVSAGRLIKEKGFDVLIQAFYHLKIKYPSLKLYIMGDGTERDELMGIIQKYQMESEIILTGFVKNVYPYFKAAQVCVVSSRIEGFPNTLLQMMSQNDRVVSTLCAGGIEDIPGIIKTPTDSVNELRYAISEALDNDPTENRVIFDKFLSERSVENFIDAVYKYLRNEKSKAHLYH